MTTKRPRHGTAELRCAEFRAEGADSRRISGRAIQAIRQEVQSIRGIRYSKYVWNPAYKGIDDYYLSRIAAQ